jgi:23S rRNA (uracil1939-C5)-methyltransferase
VVELRSDGVLPPELYAAVEQLVADGALQGVGILAAGATAHATFGDPTELSPRPQHGGTAGAADGAPGDAAPGVRVPLGGFSQANPEVNAALVATAVQWADVAGRTTLELYAGSGNLSVALVSAGAQLTTIEHDADAAALASDNLGGLGLRFKAHHRDVTKAPQTRFERVVLDPPREGARDVIDQIASVHRPERVVYVSCDPRTLARDLALLVKAGYRLQRVRGFDMFPQTPHVETVALLERGLPA